MGDDDFSSRLAMLLLSIRKECAELASGLAVMKKEREHLISIGKEFRYSLHPHRVLARKEIAMRFRTLTDRQRQVLEGILRGELNKQMAYNLGVSQKTIETHRFRVMHKVGAHSLAELVRMSVQSGILGDVRKTG